VRTPLHGASGGCGRPTFVFFSNTPEGIKQPYRRYLGNRLRDQFDFEGTPLRLHFRRRRKLGEES
jgi:Predicted GTPases